MRHAGDYSDTTPLSRSHDHDDTVEPRAPRHATTRHSRRDRSGEPYEDLLLIARWMVEHGAAGEHPFHIKDSAERSGDGAGIDSGDVAMAMARLDRLTFLDVLGYMSEASGTAMPDAEGMAATGGRTSFSHIGKVEPIDSAEFGDAKNLDNQAESVESAQPFGSAGTISFAEGSAASDASDATNATGTASASDAPAVPETNMTVESAITLQIPKISRTSKFQPAQPENQPAPADESTRSDIQPAQPTQNAQLSHAAHAAQSVQPARATQPTSPSAPALFPPSMLPTSLSPAMPLTSFPITLPALEPIAVAVEPEPEPLKPTEPGTGEPSEPEASEVPESESEAPESTAFDTGELTPIESAPATLQESLAMLLFSLDEREHAIVTQRIMSDHSSTLDELGKEFGVTRERVRQIEKSLRETLSSLLDGEFHMSERLRAMFEAEGPILRYSTAVRIVPELDITLEPEGIPVLPLIAAVCSPTFSVSDGWLASPSIDDAVKLVKTDLPQAADQYGVVDLTPSASHASSEQRERENRNFADWLSYSGIIMYRDHAIIGRAQNDRAVAVLSIEGHPLTTEEIAERIGAGNARSMRNRLADDERIMRVDVSSWGLRDWNLEEYSGIRQEIRERIERNGGSVKLDDLVQELCSQFSISSRSVMTYAASLPFVSSNGVVTLAGAERFDVPDADPYGTPRLFRIDGGWALRTTVNAEHARGSGSILPLAVAHILGMRFGDSAELASPLGTQSVYWTGTNVNLGTIRRFIQAGVIGVGDEAFLKFMDDGSFTLEPARASNGDALHDALALACCPETSDDRRAFDALRETVGNRDCSSFAMLAELFAQRGDEDIADLLRRLP